MFDNDRTYCYLYLIHEYESILFLFQGKIQAREHMTDGFDNMRSAFYGMLKGENTGKAVVKA